MIDDDLSPGDFAKFFLPVWNIGNSGGRLGWGICAWNDRKQRAPPPPEMMSVDKDTLKGKLMQTCKVNLNDTAKICWQKYFFHKVGEPIFAIFHLAVTPLLLQVLVFPLVSTSFCFFDSHLFAEISCVQFFKKRWPRCHLRAEFVSLAQLLCTLIWKVQFLP